jgi:uncharacterized protein
MAHTENMRIARIEEWLQSRFSKDASGHDWWHLHRVRCNALVLGRSEGVADLELCELGALLHDIADHKFFPDPRDQEAELTELRERLQKEGYSPERCTAVLEIVRGVSFKGAGVETPMTTLEGRVVQDADRLDALGAIGIARVFAYGGSSGRPFHNPHSTPEHHQDFAAYQKGGETAINHFYEKLLLLRDRMLTESGKKAAAERHRFMENYLAQFFSEWNGEALQR